MNIDWYCELPWSGLQSQHCTFDWSYCKFSHAFRGILYALFFPLLADNTFFFTRSSQIELPFREWGIFFSSPPLEKNLLHFFPNCYDCYTSLASTNPIDLFILAFSIPCETQLYPIFPFHAFSFCITFTRVSRTLKMQDLRSITTHKRRWCSRFFFV